MSALKYLKNAAIGLALSAAFAAASIYATYSYNSWQLEQKKKEINNLDVASLEQQIAAYSDENMRNERIKELDEQTSAKNDELVNVRKDYPIVAAENSELLEQKINSEKSALNDAKKAIADYDASAKKNEYDAIVEQNAVSDTKIAELGTKITALEEQNKNMLEGYKILEKSPSNEEYLAGKKELEQEYRPQIRAARQELMNQEKAAAYQLIELQGMNKCLELMKFNEKYHNERTAILRRKAKQVYDIDANELTAKEWQLCYSADNPATELFPVFDKMWGKQFDEKKMNALRATYLSNKAYSNCPAASELEKRISKNTSANADFEQRLNASINSINFDSSTKLEATFKSLVPEYFAFKIDFKNKDDPRFAQRAELYCAAFEVCGKMNLESNYRLSLAGKDKALERLLKDELSWIDQNNSREWQIVSNLQNYNEQVKQMAANGELKPGIVDRIFRFGLSPIIAVDKLVKGENIFKEVIPEALKPLDSVYALGGLGSKTAEAIVTLPVTVVAEVFVPDKSKQESPADDRSSKLLAAVKPELTTITDASASAIAPLDAVQKQKDVFGLKYTINQTFEGSVFRNDSWFDKMLQLRPVDSINNIGDNYRGHGNALQNGLIGTLKTIVAPLSILGLGNLFGGESNGAQPGGGIGGGQIGGDELLNDASPAIEKEKRQFTPGAESKQLLAEAMQDKAIAERKARYWAEKEEKKLAKKGRRGSAFAQLYSQNSWQRMAA